MQELTQFIKRISKDKKVTISPTTLLFKAKVLDSINILDLIGFVEKRVGRRLTNEEIVMAHFESIKKIAKTFFNNA